jgi:hypothetical protein
MSKLILKPLFNSPVQGIALALTLPVGKLNDLKDKATKAADGIGAAPEFIQTSDDLSSSVPFSLLDQKLKIPKAAFDLLRVCVVQSQNPTAEVDLTLDIVSGAVIIKVAEVPDLTPPTIQALWPTDISSQFGEVENLVLVSNGLIIETKSTSNERRRFLLVMGEPLQPDKGIETRLVWQQIAWGDASLDHLTYKNPSDRLETLQKESDARMSQGEQNSPVSRIGKFNLLAQIEGEIFVVIRHKNVSGTAPTDVRERVIPFWGLRLGRTDWSPKSLTIVGKNLKTAIFRYSSGDDPFYAPDSPNIAPFQKTSLEWNWKDKDVKKKPVLPLLKELASSPPVLSTGELSGASANSPFLWQFGKLAVDKDALEKTEPGIWIRYRVDPLAEDENLISQASDEDDGLSRPMRFEKFRHSDGNAIDHWRLDLNLLPNNKQNESKGQIWLDLSPVDGSKRNIVLTLVKARIKAASPKILALRSPLADPGALPNQANRFEGLQPIARILFANDRIQPASALLDRCALQMTLASAGAISLNAWNDAPDVVVAYVPGPVAGLDLISRSRGNLVPSPNSKPNTPPSPTQIREYESGRVAVHLIQNISLETESDQANDDGLTNTVHVGNISNLFMPSSATVSALLPWTLSRINKNKFDEHQFTPFHRNLVLDALDWERSAPDRHDPQPQNAPPLIDPSFQGTDLENKLRDFRHEEALLSLERAVRDRFVAATSASLTNNVPQSLANWLSGVKKFNFEDQELKPQVKLKLADPGSLTTLPSLEFTWQDSAPAIFPPQTLALTPSPANFTVDVDTNTLILPTHGLRNGTGIQLTSTGKLPSGLSTDTTYYVIDSTPNTFKVAETLEGSAIDITDVGSAVNTWLVQSTLLFTADASTDRLTCLTAHGLTNGTAIQLSTTGQLPGGLDKDTTYYVINSDLNTFQLAKTLAGSRIDIIEAGTSENSWLILSNLSFTADASSDTLSSKDHGLANDAAIRLTSRGKLPGGLDKDTTYYVINSDSNTFQLASTQAGTPIDITDPGSAINSWFVVSNDWLRSWLRWTQGEPNQPQLQVDRDGQKAARLAVNSDVPLLEHRTPISAVAAGWLNGRYWIFFAANDERGSTLEAWEPLSEEIPTPNPLNLPSLDPTTPIDFLAVDASAESLVLVVVQQSKFSVFEFAPPQSSQPIVNPFSFKSLNAQGKITTVRLLCKRLFIGTESGKTFSVYKFASGTLTTIFQKDIGSVSTLDVRAVTDGSVLIVAVGTGAGEVKLYGWDALPIEGDPTFSPDKTIPNRSPIFNPDIRNGELISAVTIQPLALSSKTYIYIYAAILKGDGTGRIVTWPLTSISGEAPTSFQGSEGETRGEKFLRTLTEPVSFLISDPVFNNTEALQNGAPDAHWLAAITTSNTKGKASIRTWPVSTWQSQTEFSAAEIEKLRPQVNFPVRFGNHEGTITAVALIPGRSQHTINLPKSAEFAVDIDDNTLSIPTPPGADTSPPHGLRDGTGIQLTSTGSLPGGLAVKTTYYVVRSTPYKFQLANTLAGTPIDIADVGSLVHSWLLVSDPNKSSESRFSAWIVTGGKDGTVRIWDPETGFERFSHTVTPSNAWIDTLGVVRRKIEPNKGDGFWIEPIDVPTSLETNSESKKLFVLSTLGEPFTLIEDSGSNTAMRFLCQNLHLSKNDSGTFKPIPFDDNNTTHTFRHGIYGCDDDNTVKVNHIPRIGGLPVEIIRLKELKFKENLDENLNKGQFVNPTSIIFEALLSNPASSPDGNSVPLQQGTATINIHFKRDNTDNNFKLSLKDSDFDWQFSLTEQLPLGKSSVLPGRLARIMGKVTLDDNGRLKLEPKTIQAEVLGALRPIPTAQLPALVFDKGNDNPQKIRFRESLEDSQAQLEQSGNLLPFPSTAQIVATSTGTDRFDEPVALIASQAEDLDKKGSAVLADLETGQTRTRFTEGLKQAQLLVEDTEDDNKRLTAVGVAEDGTVRIQRLWDIKKDAAKIVETEIEPSLQNWVHYVLPSPAENVQVFEIKEDSRLWLLARCRDGSAWLWDSIHGEKYDLSLPNTAVTTVVFGPQIPADVFGSNEEYQHWRDFFGQFDSELTIKFDTVVAIGGADGSVHIYAVVQENNPVLVRSLFVLNEPVQSLSMAIDKNSFEAATLGRSGEEVLDGLALLICDGSSSVQLIEVISGLSLISDIPEDQRPEPLKSDTGAFLGELLYEYNKLRIILKTSRQNTFSVNLVRKEIPSATSRFRNQFIASPILTGINPENIDNIFSNNDLVTIVSKGAKGRWSVFQIDGNDYILLKNSDVESIIHASVCEVFNLAQRYLLAVRTNGSLSFWVQKEPKTGKRNKWTPVLNSSLNRPAYIDNALLGLVTVPMVACYGNEGRLGHVWDINEGISATVWPETLGSVDVNTPVALTSVNGVPHLAVARPTDVTVWNLATGQLVYRLGVEQAPVSIDIATDLDHLWLLVGRNFKDEISYEICNVFSNLRKEIPDFKGTLKNIDARFVTLTSGLNLFASQRQISLAAGIKTTTLQTKIFRFSLSNIEITLTEVLGTPHSATDFSLSEDPFSLLDVISFKNGEFWMLALVGTQPLVVPIQTGVSLIFPIPQTATSAPITAAFDPAPGDLERPLVWTVGANWNSVTSWSLPDPSVPPVPLTPGAAIDDSGRPPGLKVGESPAYLATSRYNGRTRLIAISTGGLAIWDLLDKKIVHTASLQRAIPRVVPMVISAAIGVDTKAGCIRFWDRYTGRLRQRLFIKNTDVNEPKQLKIIPSPARPRLVIAGAIKGVALFDLYSATTITIAPNLLLSISASLMVAESTDVNERIVVAGIEDGVVKVWRSPLGQEATLFDTALTLTNLPNNPLSLELLRLKDRMLLAVAETKVLMIFDIPSDTPTTLTKLIPATSKLEDNRIPTSNDFEITNVRLTQALDPDCILVALALKSTLSLDVRLELLDLPIRKLGSEPLDRQFTRWVNNNKSLSGSIALMCDNDGPRVVAGTEVFRASLLLRIYQDQPPRFDLPVQICNDKSFLTGRITPSRRLDLQISLSLNPEKLGLPKTVQKLSARANLIQGSYSCFLIDGIDNDDFRLTGALVLWESLNLSSRDFQGLLLIDDTNINAKATVELPSKPTSPLSLDVSGMRVRMRAIPFSAESTTIDSLKWREVISWYLASDAPLQTEWHLADAVLDIPAESPASNQQIVKAIVSSSDSNAIQGDILVNLNRNVNDSGESYNLSVNATIYAVRSFDKSGISALDNSQNDLVYPATSQGSLGRAFDLFEPLLGQSNQAELFQLATLIVERNIPKLLKVESDRLSLDLNTGTNVNRALPKHSVTVPQLIHREAQGARIRGRWPSTFTPLQLPDSLGAALANTDRSQWLLSPLAVTPQGVMALTQNLLVLPKGKLLNWTRLQTECVLVIHSNGGALFDRLSSNADNESPSMLNLLTKTVLRSSGAIERKPIALFDDEQIQSYALSTGTKGVLLVRTADARSRVKYHLVNSPYYSLTPTTIKLVDDKKASLAPAPVPVPVPVPAPASDEGEDRVSPDPRILSPQKISKLSLLGSPRYQPVMVSGDRPNKRGFQIFDKLPAKTLHVVHLAEIPALKATENPIVPIDFIETPPDSSEVFLPLKLELSFGLTKPGGTFHQTIQCLSNDNSTLAPLTTFARRESQQFTPPLRSAIQLDNPTLKQQQNNKLEIELPWTEIIGTVTLQNNDSIDNAEFVIESDGAETPIFTLKEKEASKVLKWIVRLGEKIQILDKSLPIPFTPFRDGKKVDFFDLFLVTRIKLDEKRSISDGTTIREISPMLVLIDNEKREVKSVKPLASILEKVVDNQDGYYVWKIKRDRSQSPIFLEWIKGFENIDDIDLNLIWWDIEDINYGTFERTPKLYDVKLRDVAYEPQLPRLAAVLRLPPSAGQGLFAPSREFTLFYGPAASAKGITPTIQISSDRTLIQFTAQDAEMITLTNSLPTPPVDCGISIVKYFEDGATLTTSKLISVKL